MLFSTGLRPVVLPTLNTISKLCTVTPNDKNIKAQMGTPHHSNTSEQYILHIHEGKDIDCQRRIMVNDLIYSLVTDLHTTKTSTTHPTMHTHTPQHLTSTFKYLNIYRGGALGSIMH